MAVLDSIEEWQHQSSLLLQARPTTTRITTKYHIPNLSSAKYQKPTKRKRDTDGETKDPAAAAPRVPRAVLSLKTYDPESGVCLRFQTDRAADVGRLIAGLGRLGRHSAALPQKAEEPVAQRISDGADAAEGAARPASVAQNAAPSAAKSQQESPAAAGGGGGKKKKKGKK